MGVYYYYRVPVDGEGNLRIFESLQSLFESAHRLSIGDETAWENSHLDSFKQYPSHAGRDKISSLVFVGMLTKLNIINHNTIGKVTLVPL